VVLSRKGPKSRTHGRKLRSTGTKASTRVIRAPNALVELERQLEVRTRQLTEARENLAEALEQQTAASEVLNVISQSASELQPVLDKIVEIAAHLCQADYSFIWKLDRGIFHLAAINKVEADFAKFAREHPHSPNRGTVAGRSVLERRTVHIPDVLQDPGYDWREGQKISNYRTLLGVPLLREGVPLGAFVLMRSTVRPFTEKQIELVSNFANQAVIAIENTRLLNELRESLQQQTATADVLKVISRSTFDLQTVLDTLVESAARLCEADMAAISRPMGQDFQHLTSYGYSSAHKQYMQTHPIPSGRGSVSGRTVLEGKVVHIPDVRADPNYTLIDRERFNVRTMLGVPLLREGTAIGVIVLQRSTVRPFTDKQIELATTFADQAVIAIENVRLFEAEQQRTRELSEALEQQTATSEVLRVISSSPGELEPVFRSILEKATHICQAKFGGLYLYDSDGFRPVALHNAPPAYAATRTRDLTFRPPPDLPLGRVIITKRAVQIDDAKATKSYMEGNPFVRAGVDLGGYRTVLVVPMLKENTLVGAIGIYRQEVRPFADNQVELLSNFAKQAVIAIENTRLLNELRESLQQQTATADVLKVISRSAFNLKSVLQTLVESAARLCEADKATIARKTGGAFVAAESYGFSPEFLEYVRAFPMVPERGTIMGRALLEGKVVHVPDVMADPEYTWAEAPKRGGFRTALGVPMLRDSVAIGVFALTRSEVRPFTEKQIELVTTFADQAAIAIENVRLFDEIQDKNQQLQQASEYKSQFVASMSHELRTRSTPSSG
jgi:two-component system, NtrC family, sensor kinase